jgi:deoxycytidylate deaminase
MRGATVYLTLSPCMVCAKRMVTEGISRVVYPEVYRDAMALEFLTRAGIECTYTGPRDVAGWAVKTEAGS